MKTFVLTGMATEHDFSNQKEQYLLVFNKGELRVPVSEEAAQEVIKSLFSGETQSAEGEETMARPKPPEQGVVMAPVGSAYSDDDDGVDQV